MAKNSNPPRPGGPPRPAGPAGPKAPSRPRPKTGGQSWSPPTAVAAPKVPEAPVHMPAAPPKQEELAMVPLSGQSDGTYDDGRRTGSSTEFFAIPHANRAKAVAPSGSGMLAAPGPPMAAGVAPMGGPVPMGPVPVGGIQGPVAVGPMGGAGGGAYGVVDGNLDDGRTQSYRVFGVVIALVMMVCLALLVTVGLVVVAVMNQTPEDEPVIVQNPPVAITPIAQADTGGPPKEAAPKPRPKKTKPTKPRPTGPKTPVAPGTPEPANGASAAGTPGTVSVRIPKGMYVSQFEISCPSAGAFRARGSFTNQQATIANVPAVECTGRFKGGGVTSKVIIRGGSANLNCSAINASTLDCR